MKNFTTQSLFKTSQTFDVIVNILNILHILVKQKKIKTIFIEIKFIYKK